MEENIIDLMQMSIRVQDRTASGSFNSGLNKSRSSPHEATPSSAPPPRRNSSQQHFDAGYDRRIHQNVLYDYQGGNECFATDDLAYQGAPPSQHGFRNANFFEGTNFIPELMNLISELIHCFQNRDFFRVS